MHPTPQYGQTVGTFLSSERGRIGATWWSQRFIAVLESFQIGGRLTRGRAYARRGQVVSLTVAPGVVSAQVQGSRATPYQVSIGFAVLPGATWTAIEAALGAQALYRAQLLAGEMPADLEDVVTEAGGWLFPLSVRDLVMRCSCPDAAVPCKHIAATFYLLAERFDDDPFAILLWRGRSREALLADLGTGAEAADAGRPTAASPEAVLADLPTPDVATSLDRFWLPPVPLPPRRPTFDAGADLVLRQLPDPPPGLGGKALTEALRGYYLALPDADDAADVAAD